MTLEPTTHTGVDDVHAHPRHVGHRWLDLMLALTAIFICGVLLYIAMEHGRIERQLMQENAQLVQANSWHALADAFLKASRVISYQACYCSVFDVCWMSNLSSLKPHKVTSCPQDGRDFNQDAESDTRTPIRRGRQQ